MRYILLTVITLMFSSAILSQFSAVEKVIFATFPIPLMVENKSEGVFIELTRAIEKRLQAVSSIELDIGIVVYPPKRCLDSFVQKKCDAIFPALDVNFDSSKTPFARTSESIYVKVDYCFTRKGDPMVKTIADINGLRVGITRGYPYIKELMNDPRIDIHMGPTDEINVNKLMKKRIDVFVVEEKSGLKAFEKMGHKDHMQYDPQVPLGSQEVYYAFQDTERGRRLAKVVSQAITEMKKDGSFVRIMKKAVDQN